jgi:hypothetical protein
MKITSVRHGREKLIKKTNGQYAFTVLETADGIVRLKEHALNLESVRELRDHLTAWLETGSLEIKCPNPERVRRAMTSCPRCGGEGENFVTFIRYAPGHTGPPSRMIPCHQCDGNGEITDEQAKWIVEGEAMRRERIARNVGLRQEADRRRMLPSAYADMESGRVEPIPADPQEQTHATD